MKFAKYLAADLVSEWKTKYIHYKKLKRLVADCYVEQQSFIAEDHEHQQHQQRHRQQQELRQEQRERAEEDSQETCEEMTRPYTALPPTISRTRQRRTSSAGDIKAERSSELFAPEDDESSIIPLKEMNVEPSPRQRIFFAALDAELDKINAFSLELEVDFTEKVQLLHSNVAVIVKWRQKREALKKLRKLSSSTVAMEEDPQSTTTWQKFTSIMSPVPIAVEMPASTQSDGNTRLRYLRAPQRIRVKQALTECYRGIELLRNYRILNYTGFVKIMKKYDKTMQTRQSPIYLKKVQAASFYTSPAVERLLAEVEDMYIEAFASGQRHIGMKKLRRITTRQTQHVVSYRVGMFLGLAIPAAIFASVYASNQWDNIANASELSQIVASLLLPVIFLLLFDLNLLVWHKCKINYQFIFEFDPRSTHTYRQHFEIGAFFFLLWSYMAVLTVLNPLGRYGCTPQVYPMVYVVLCLAGLIAPVSWVPYRPARSWFTNTLRRIAIAPFHRVEFRDFFITDELMSLANYTFGNMYLFGCSYAVGWKNLDSGVCTLSRSWVTPALVMLPPWWRLLQCLRRYHDTKVIFPHLVNAGKYSFTIASVWAGAFWHIQGTNSAMVMYILLTIAAAVYRSWWDVYMDWGLGRRHVRYWGLRDKLLYSWHWYYYFALICNFPLRMLWIVQLSPTMLSVTNTNPSIYAFGVAIGEVYRRFEWNFFRMENEHLNNCGQFRAIKDIPLPFTQSMGDEQLIFGPHIPNPPPAPEHPDSQRTASTNSLIANTFRKRFGNGLLPLFIPKSLRSSNSDLPNKSQNCSRDYEAKREIPEESGDTELENDEDDDEMDDGGSADER